MASYLTTATIGEFDVEQYKAGRSRCWDAIDPDLDREPQPRSGRQFAISGIGQPAYKRLARTINVPAGGRRLSFWVERDTEPNWDFFFVEAHTAGQDDWTTLRDLNGHNSQDTGNSCFGSCSSIRSWSATTRWTSTPSVRPDRNHRRVVGGERRERRLRAVDRGPRP